MGARKSDDRKSDQLRLAGEKGHKLVREAEGRQIGPTLLEILKEVVEGEDQENSYGMYICTRMSQRRGLVMNPSQIFVGLKRLKIRELIEENGTRSIYGSPPVKLYRATRKGRQLLARALADMAVMLRNFTVTVGRDSDDRQSKKSRTWSGTGEATVNWRARKRKGRVVRLGKGRTRQA